MIYVHFLNGDLNGRRICLLFRCSEPGVDFIKVGRKAQIIEIYATKSFPKVRRKAQTGCKTVYEIDPGHLLNGHFGVSYAFEWFFIPMFVIWIPTVLLLKVQ